MNLLNKYIYIFIIFGFIFLLKRKKELFNSQKIISDKNKIYNTYVLYIPKREKYIKNIIDKLNLSATYIKGINKNSLNFNNLIKENIITEKWFTTTKKPIKYIKSINKGRIACHLGHIQILKEFLESNNKYALIFEDDININNNFSQISFKINKIINNIPKDADIVYISYCFEICKKIIKINEMFSHAYRPLCRHFYIVSRKGAQIIINKTIPMYSSGDRMVGDLIAKKILNGYIVNPSYLMIEQKRDINTDLETTLDNTQDHRLCL